MTTADMNEQNLSRIFKSHIAIFSAYSRIRSHTQTLSSLGSPWLYSLHKHALSMVYMPRRVLQMEKLWKASQRPISGPFQLEGKQRSLQYHLPSDKHTSKPSLLRREPGIDLGGVRRGKEPVMWGEGRYWRRGKWTCRDPKTVSLTAPLRFWWLV